ncbi:MAG: diaminopimelate decarboxylase [Gammaproteobacteria bacterium]|nr:MAG: diaminopimelate decarboxylase [Gammaproteobacteria bacterium]
MDYFEYRDGRLQAEAVDLMDVVQYAGTPCYVYSRATLERHWRVFDETLAGHDHLVCYAVKANSSLAVLQVLAQLGSGFDIVSGGELQRVLQAGGDPARVVFSGVGKRATEMQQALEAGIRCFNVESKAELLRLNDVAGHASLAAPVALRVNPDVDAGTHPYISTGLRENKFGIDVTAALDIYRQAADLPHLEVIGIDCHIGSQLTDVTPFVDALERVLELVARLQSEGITLRHVDVGGGLGIRYKEGDNPPLPDAYARALLDKLVDSSLEILLEPGRAIAGNAGILLTRVEYLKSGAERNFAIVDAAMNDLQRPALYDAWHDIIPLQQHSAHETRVFEVVGPVCETGDFLGKGRKLALAEGDLLAVRSAGAYGFTMSSNYNSRPRAAEIMVDGDRFTVIRERETLEDLTRGEHLLPQ